MTEYKKRRRTNKLGKLLLSRRSCDLNRPDTRELGYSKSISARNTEMNEQDRGTEADGPFKGGADVDDFTGNHAGGKGQNGKKGTEVRRFHVNVWGHYSERTADSSTKRALDRVFVSLRYESTRARRRLCSSTGKPQACCKKATRSPETSAMVFFDVHREANTCWSLWLLPGHRVACFGVLGISRTTYVISFDLYLTLNTLIIA